jgi:hypothetical protein
MKPNPKTWRKGLRSNDLQSTAAGRQNNNAQQLSSQPSFNPTLNFMAGICLLETLGETFEALPRCPPPRRSKAITASAFSPGFALATVNFGAIPVD